MSKEEILGEIEKEEREDASLEEEINKRALKIGRKVLDEICVHSENSIEVSIRKSSFYDGWIVEVGVHSVTGLFDSQVEFIKREGLREKKLKDFEIKKKEKNDETE